MASNSVMVHARVSREEAAYLAHVSEQLGVTRSELLRGLFRTRYEIITDPIFAQHSKADHVVALYSAKDIDALNKAIRKFGYQYNQVAHALNKLCLKRTIPMSVIEEELRPALETNEVIRRRMSEIDAQWQAARKQLESLPSASISERA